MITNEQMLDALAELQSDFSDLHLALTRNGYEIRDGAQVLSAALTRGEVLRWCEVAKTFRKRKGDDPSTDQ